MACKICGHSVTRPVDEHGSSCNLQRCVACGFVFKYGTNFDYEEMPDSYYNSFNFDRLREAEEIIAVIRKRFKKLNGLNILEIGCGTGALLREFREFGMNVFGYEPSSRAVEIARSKFNLTTVKNGYFAANRIDINIDVFLLCDVLEHLVDPVPLMTNVCSTMGERALFVIRSGDPCSLNARFYPSKWRYFLIEQHVAFYSKTALSFLCERVGLRVDAYYRFRHAYGGIAFGRLASNIAKTVVNRVVAGKPRFEQKFIIEIANDHFIAVLKKGIGNNEKGS